ncbi:MAG: PilN domain-containing protein [Gammaproteobacteria bacterium]|nr:PilN domain-containing protein [Gammaproteobacteria bacterium]
MPNINLLPWREEAKQKRVQEFYAIIGAAFALAVLLVVGVLQFVGSKIELQQRKNNYLQQEITIVEQKISEIKTLRETKNNLKKRMDLVERLQNTRNLPTYLLDTMAKIVAPGVYLSQIKREGNAMWIEGLSESNNHLANTIRNVETSQWYSEPLLQKINTKTEQLRQLNKFSMRVNINLHADSE